MTADPAIPTCLRDAYGFLTDDRAWVACLSFEDGVHTIASKAKAWELARDPLAGPFVSARCPKETRAAFLLTGVLALERELC